VARQNAVPVIVVSSGMVPVTRGLLLTLLGEELMRDIEIVANGTKVRPPGNSLDEPDG
jgi:2-hydroxy-3-keto-5-methylthiopentenyl-1-phosphate phosphatase